MKKERTVSVSAYLKQVKIAFKLLVLLSLLTGFVYPLTVTGIAKAFFNWKAQGSLIPMEEKTMGSSLIGQSFTEAKYFWGRPSATSPFPYNASASSGSNLGPSNPDFLYLVKHRIAHLKNITPQSSQQTAIPVDLVTASASGLDPEISPRAAYYQVSRIAKARHLTEEEVRALVQHLIKSRTFGILGEPRVNVLELNLALDQLEKTSPQKNKG